jgi:hypothetical protein
MKLSALGFSLLILLAYTAPALAQGSQAETAAACPSALELSDKWGAERAAEEIKG